MHREDERDIVAPEAELANREHTCHEDTELDHGERFRLQCSTDPVKQCRHDDQRRNLEDSQQASTADNLQRQNRQQRTSEKSTQFLPQRHARNNRIAFVTSRLFLIGRVFRFAGFFIRALRLTGFRFRCGKHLLMT